MPIRFHSELFAKEFSDSWNADQKKKAVLPKLALMLILVIDVWVSECCWYVKALKARCSRKFNTQCWLLKKTGWIAVTPILSLDGYKSGTASVFVSTVCAEKTYLLLTPLLQPRKNIFLTTIISLGIIVGETSIVFLFSCLSINQFYSSITQTIMSLFLVVPSIAIIFI